MPAARSSQLDHRLSDLWRAERRQIQRHSDLPRPDRRPACRQSPSDHRQARLVGRRWSAPASRSTPTAISSSAPMWSAAAWARPARPRSIRRPASPTASTCRSSPSRDMVRAQAMLIDPLGIDDLFCVVGGSMGGMQVLQWAASYPERVFAAMPIATRRAPFLAEHRLPRGRPPGDHGRSRLARRRLSRRRASPDQGPRRRAHGRAHHLSVGGGAAAQIRPQAAGPRRADLLLRRRLPGRELPAPPGLELRRPLRRQFLSLRHAGLDYFDLAADYGGSLARAFKGAKTRFCVVSFTSDWLYPTRRARAPSCMR